MLKRLSFIFLILLVALSLQSNTKIMQTVPTKPQTTVPGINRADVIMYAKKYMGTKYKHAGINPETGFDCSGFVYFVFKNFDIDLPRGSKEYQFLKPALKPEEFKVGDVLVFYGYRDKTHIGHVGIICEAAGMNSKFIHSSSGAAYGVTISELGSEMYTRRFYKCISVIK